MLTRCLAVAVVALAGCAGGSPFKIPRTIWSDGGRTEIPPTQTEVAAKVGDVLYLEVGPGELDARNKGFRATINGRRADQSAWDCPYATLYYQFRAKAPGTYKVEVYAPYKDEGAKELTWNITVKE